MLMNGRKWCVLSLSLIATSGSLTAAVADGPVRSMPNLEGATYVCKGDGIVIDAHIKKRLENCKAHDCIYVGDLFENGILVPADAEKSPNQYFMTMQDHEGSWALIVSMKYFQLASIIFDDETVSESITGPHPFSIDDGVKYPKVSCTLSLKSDN